MSCLQAELGRQESDFVPSAVSFQGQIVSLVLESGMELCQIADVMLDPLTRVSKIDTIFFRGFVDRNACLRRLERAEKLHEGRIKAEINVYGRAEAGSR